MKNIFVKQKNLQADFFDSLKELKLEMQLLQEQLKKTQKQVENDVMILQKRLYLLSVAAPISQQNPSSVRFDIVCDVHQQVDEFFYKQSKKMV